MSWKKGAIIGGFIGLLFAVWEFFCLIDGRTLCTVVYPLILITQIIHTYTIRAVGLTGDFIYVPFIFLLSILIFAIIGILIQVIYSKINSSQ